MHGEAEKAGMVEEAEEAGMEEEADEATSMEVEPDGFGIEADEQFHLIQTVEAPEHLTMEARLEAEHAGVAAFVALVGDPGLMAENQAILMSLRYEREVAANHRLIHLREVRQCQRPPPSWAGL